MQIEDELRASTKIERGVQQGRIYSLYIFNFYSKMIQRGQVDQWGFNIRKRNLNNIHGRDDTVLNADSEGKLKGVLHKAFNESKKK